MRKFALFILLLLLAAPAFPGDRIGRQGEDEVKLFESPCVSVETYMRIPEGERRSYSKAVGLFQGQKFFGCWKPMGEGVYILWEDGDQGIIPGHELQPLTEI